MPLDLQAWLFSVGLHPEGMKITSVAKATIYKYYLGLETVVYLLTCTLASTILSTLRTGESVISWDLWDQCYLMLDEPRSQLYRAVVVEGDTAGPQDNEGVHDLRRSHQATAGAEQSQIISSNVRPMLLCRMCADFHPVHYMKALEELLGKESVYQLMKMSGHVMVGLDSIEKVERLVENGLTINNIFLRAFPYRRKAEKIILGNLPIAVREEDINEALRPYCRVVSLAYEVVSCNGYTWTTGNREAFVFLNEGRKLHQLSAKLVIISKVESTPAYITSCVRCSRCHLQGYRRATCPLGINGGHHQDTRQGLVSKPPFSMPSNNSAPIAAESSAPIKQTSSTSSSSAAPSSAANFPVRPYKTPASELPVPAPSTSQLPSRPDPSSTNTEPSVAPAEENQTMNSLRIPRRCKNPSISTGLSELMTALNICHCPDVPSEKAHV
ncbi:hypothetical protein LAZ67_8001392 [Cordylochernes scorpioides]|uniref:Uncharacterized protein n=1 Tax=Cordylochernes scorpioides TaxID=51811 RepID=A0ABY6KQ64_9ARAC|nr:hypothetical protein LAZ67_8001392 [Cordylochernes scorpioides]